MRGFLVVDASRRLLMSASQYSKLFCTGNNKIGTNKVNGVVPPARDLDVYQQLEKLDFMTAAKILFTTPPKKKKFGIDFHLVQLFFACMPSLAVYLVAQYARYEIRRMEAEEELKKKQAEEEEKAKEIEASTSEEIPELWRDPELLNVKVRLDALEETVKQIAFETKKVSGGNKSAAQDSNKREKPVSLNSLSKSCASADKNLTPQAEKSNVSNETVSGSAPSPETAKSEQGRVE